MCTDRPLYAIEKDLVTAVRKALLNLRGAHGVVVMSPLEPDKIVAARIGNAGGVVIGLGKARCSWPRTSRRSWTTRGG